MAQTVADQMVEVLAAAASNELWRHRRQPEWFH